MARKKQPTVKKTAVENVYGLHAETTEQLICDTLEQNYMPYAMSVIVSRAIPEIDGFKPSHRKLLYTMYRSGLLTGGRTKSANIVGQTMRLNPHGDAAIYETMVRLSRGYEALLHPFVDSKGNFGKTYSRDMAYAASRYTEAKLAPICAELFRDIDHNTVDFVDNYDGTLKEPTLLPTAFPNVLVSANQGIAVGMASMICGFNLAEVCHTTAEYIKNPKHDIMSTLKAPDFPTGGELLYDAEAMKEIYETGRGSFKVRSKWRYDKSQNVIEIYEIPYTTTSEAIIDKTAELMKLKKITEISDMRDETDISGLKIAIDLKRGVDPERFMQKLFRMTPLLDTFSCNFNILIAGMPRVMGVREIIEEWSAWRFDCVRRRVHEDLKHKKELLHLLKGLKKILLDIDRAIKIIRETEEESEVVPNLMIGFGIDKIQAEFIADIKLRNINKQYILKRIAETDNLEKTIEELTDVLNSKKKINAIICSELNEIAKKYGIPRKTDIIYDADTSAAPIEEERPEYPVSIFLTKEGYFKKITPLSLRMGGEHKFKEGDSLSQSFETTNCTEVIFITSACQAYKAHMYDFDDTKASAFGDYLPTKLNMDSGESVIFMLLPDKYKGSLLTVYENGCVSRVEMASFMTTSNRRRLTGAYSDKSPAVAMFHITAETQIALTSSDGRALIFSTSSLTPKQSRATKGVSVMSLKKNNTITSAVLFEKSGLLNPSRFRVRKLPASGSLIRAEDVGEEQMSLL